MASLRAWTTSVLLLAGAWLIATSQVATPQGGAFPNPPTLSNSVGSVEGSPEVGGLCLCW